MHGVLRAPLAELFELKTVGELFLIFLRITRNALAHCAFELCHSVL